MAWAGFSENDWINQALRFWGSGPNAVYNTLISVGLTPSEANQVVNKADEIFRANQPPGEPEEPVSEPTPEPTPESTPAPTPAPPPPPPAPPPPPPVTVTLNSWQKYDANGNIVNKTMGDYTTDERVPFAQNIIDKQKAAGVNLSPAEFTTFAQQQGVPLSEIPPLLSKLTFPTVTQQQVIDTIVNPVTPIFTPTAPLPENPLTTAPKTPTLNPWQKLDANGNIVEKTMADYTTQERIPFAQNVIDQNKLQGKLVTPSEFRTFALAQGVPETQLDDLINGLTFPQQPVVNPTPNPWQTVDQSGNIVQKKLSDYTSAELIPYIQNLFRDNPNATAQMVRQYAASQNVPASVIDAALGGVQVPTANFSQFTVGGGNTSLATPTTDFFYGAGPTEQAPYMFKSGAAGYTRLLPQSLEFGIPAVTGNKPTFQPGIFDKIALQNTFESQTGINYGGESVDSIQQQLQEASYMGGKITPDKIAYKKGGKVKSLLGPKPDSPDDGYASLQVGEYVIRKKAVNKYGEDFLEALNESRIPKKKAKGLL